jgi:CRISPR-associated protein Cas2
MRYVIAYDIADDKRRTKLVKQLESVAERVQRSVFEADLAPSQLAQLLKKASEIMDLDQDGLRVYRLCGDCAAAAQTFGREKIVPPPGVIIV